MSDTKNEQNKVAEKSGLLDKTNQDQPGLGSQLADIGRSLNGVTIDISRDPTPVKNLQIVPTS